jgi:hypothetical protein
MGVSLKTENEDSAGETVQERGSKGGRRGFTGTLRIDLPWVFPGAPPPASPIAQS